MEGIGEPVPMPEKNRENVVGAGLSKKGQNIIERGFEIQLFKAMHAI